MASGYEKLGEETIRTPIMEEDFQLSEGAIDIEVADNPLRIVNPERDLGESWNVDCMVVDPSVTSRIEHRIGYKGLRDGETIVLGRSHTYGGRFHFTDYVSREHVRITREGDVVRVSDLNSQNGTYKVTRLEPASSRASTVLETPALSTLEVEVPRERRFTVAGMSVASEMHPERNEDAYFVDENARALGAFDGVGGAYGSEKASQIAAQTVAEFLGNVDTKQMPRGLAQLAIREALLEAHQNILKEPNGAHIATTATIAKVFETENGKPYVVIGSVGDSRAALLRDGRMMHLTLDQAFVQGDDTETAKRLQTTLAQATSLSQLSDHERQAFMMRNVIDSHLGGMRGVPTITVSDFEIHNGDSLLITSDGIHDNLTIDEIESVLRDQSNVRDATRLLVTAAQDRSREPGHIRSKPDDMTAVILTYS